MIAKGNENGPHVAAVRLVTKVVPHRRLLISDVASDIFGADQSTVIELDA
jgi:hypothetical protein